MQAVRVPYRWVAGVSARRCARESPRPKVPLYERAVLYLARSRTSALVLVADAQLPYRYVGFGSIAASRTFIQKTTVSLPIAIRTGCTSWCYSRGMKRATITLPDDLEQALERFVEEQEVPVQLTAVVQSAVREYLGERGYLETSSPLRIRPANRGSGQKDVSISHDRYLSAK